MKRCQSKTFLCLIFAGLVLNLEVSYADGPETELRAILSSSENWIKARGGTQGRDLVAVQKAIGDIRRARELVILIDWNSPLRGEAIDAFLSQGYGSRLGQIRQVAVAALSAAIGGYDLSNSFEPSPASCLNPIDVPALSRLISEIRADESEDVLEPVDDILWKLAAPKIITDRGKLPKVAEHPEAENLVRRYIETATSPALLRILVGTLERRLDTLSSVLEDKTIDTLLSLSNRVPKLP